MGNGASAGVAAAVAAAKPEELEAAMTSLDPASKAKLAAALSSTPASSPHVTTIMYDFEDKQAGDDWYAHFLSDAEDGWLVTAAAPGMQVCKLFKADGSDTKYGWYEEWDVASSQIAYTKHRFATGFLAKWLGLDVTLKPPRFTMLKEDNGVAVEQGVLVKTTTVKAPPVAKRTYCVNTKLVFKEQSDCDAFLTDFAESDDGFKAMGGAAGCCLLKLFKATPDDNRWQPATSWTTSFAGLYEEWESKEAFEAHRVMRDNAMVKWLGDAGAKLKDSKPVVEEYVMGISSIMGKSDLAS